MNKLDNPVWHALSETHAIHCISLRNCKFYQPQYCVFGAFTDSDDIAQSMNQYSSLFEMFFIVGEQPRHDDSVRDAGVVVCDQMILDEPIRLAITNEIVALNRQHEVQLQELVNLVQPGYFRPSTPALGSYFGIFSGDRLVAAAGERMKMDDLTEISAVVTHPTHQGQGLGRQLVAHIANRVFGEGKIPFLHVAETNAGAIALYEKLGFRYRRKMAFRKFTSTQIKNPGIY